MDADATRTLRTIPPFDTVSEATVVLLARGARERAHPSGTVIWREGTRAHALHVLLAGTARAVRSRGGRELVVHRARPGQTLGEIPLFDGEPYPASLVAESPVRILVLDGASVAAALKADPALALFFLRTLSARVRELARRLETLTADPVRTRLARHLLARADASVRETFTLGMTQTALAHDLGTVREVVARHLGALVRSGGLERTERSTFRIADRGLLEAMVEAD